MKTPCVLEKILLFATVVFPGIYSFSVSPGLTELIYIYIHIHFCQSVVCDVYTSSHPYFFLAVNDLHFLFALFIQAPFFFDHYRLCHECHHSFHFIFINTASHLRIQQINSSGMVNPYTLIALGKGLFFGDHCWGTESLFYIYHMASFDYDAKEEGDVGLCRCHL